MTAPLDTIAIGHVTIDTTPSLEESVDVVCEWLESHDQATLWRLAQRVRRACDPGVTAERAELASAVRSLAQAQGLPVGGE